MTDLLSNTAGGTSSDGPTWADGASSQMIDLLVSLLADSPSNRSSAFTVVDKIIDIVVADSMSRLVGRAAQWREWSQLADLGDPSAVLMRESGIAQLTEAFVMASENLNLGVRPQFAEYGVDGLVQAGASFLEGQLRRAIDSDRVDTEWVFERNVYKGLVRLFLEAGESTQHESTR